MTSKRLMTIAGAVIALAVVAAAVVVLLESREDDVDRTTLAGALRLAPADTQRFSWTDWAGVRRQVGLELTASSPGPAVQDLLDRGFDADLTPSSALGSSAVVMQDRLGFSPATLDWELFNQGPGVASLAMRAGPGVDFDAVAAALRNEGYAEPAGPDGYWVSDPGQDEITAQVTPELLLIALDPENSMIFASDTGTGILAAVDAGARAETEALPAGIVEAAGQPLAASLYTGDQVCNALALARADD
ncbi:hypothetical protein, partial [Nocardioides sp.]|uniref:hypothetical protein n=1 Tax=Nocardioides sp. TaxID=35761 RepID=UPI002B26E58A